ncbi:MAG: ATP-dependent Clp protease adaptor protein ClpS [Patiriisocius sp.]|jgi:ATP-dependent Clp protease adaptor protein ClpS
MTKEAYQEEVLVDEKLENQVILYNDDVNTFDWVIESLVKVCDHEPVQAEQCAWLVHLKGKCAVKNGGFDDLRKYQAALSDRGLSAEIE